MDVLSSFAVFGVLQSHNKDASRFGGPSLVLGSL